MKNIFESPLIFIVPNIICVLIGIIIFIIKARDEKCNSDDLIGTAATTFIMAFLGWAAFELAIIVLIIGTPIFFFTKFCKRIKGE